MVDEAVQIALLNNRELQALYSDLGVAQADLVQAGLLKNPIFDAAILFPVASGGRPKLELSAVWNFLDIFYVPLRKRVAAARFEEAKLGSQGSCSTLAPGCGPHSYCIRRMSKCSNCAKRLSKRSTRLWKLRDGFTRQEISRTSTSPGKGRLRKRASWRSDPPKSPCGKAAKS